MRRFLFLYAVTLAVVVNGYPQNKYMASEDLLAAATRPQEVLTALHNPSQAYADALDQSADDSQNEEQLEGSQAFYPSFAPFQNQPLGHSRPFYQQETAYSHRPTAYQQHVGFDSNPRFSGYKTDRFATSASESEGLLGSGNFGVIRGGTFYHDNERESSSNYDQYNSFFHNGHGRPSYYFGGNPRPRQYQQFENFRDFADINVPSNPAYSQYVVVYANKNGSKFEPEQQKNKPKNIMEHLALIDLENESTTTVPSKKLSKSKRKLSATALLKKKLAKNEKELTTTMSPRDLYEPLLALS